MYDTLNKNTLYYGDNLSVMRKMPDGCIDLIYLDPPFNSNRTYNLLYKNATGMPVPEQADAFCDTWELDAEKEDILREMPAIMKKYDIETWMVDFWRTWVNALRVANPRLLAYLIYMFVRLLEMRRILKITGSIYLHCDPTASHYIKILLDGIFGLNNFRNEIIWDYSRSKGVVSAKFCYPRKHDTLFFYTKEDNNSHYFKTQRYPEKRSIPELKKDYAGDYFYCDDEGYIEWSKIKHKTNNQAKRFYKKFLDKYNREPRDGDKVFIIKEPIVKSVWNDINILNMSVKSKERLGYPTQKPIALLERIIKASCPTDGIVFDPFCGCGTTIYATHRLNQEGANRKWYGCDIAILSIKLIQEVIGRRYGLIDGEHYNIEGIPVSEEQARYLFKQNALHFQTWAATMAGGFCNTKKTADKGIDGNIYFEVNQDLKAMILSVKGGNVKPADIRDLVGAMQSNSNCELAGFISLKEPSEQMRQAAAVAGKYEYRGYSYDKVQLRTIKELLDGKPFHTPSKVTLIHKDKEYPLAL